jgi:hypothetical protein
LCGPLSTGHRQRLDLRVFADPLAELAQRLMAGIARRIQRLVADGSTSGVSGIPPKIPAQPIRIERMIGESLIAPLRIALIALTPVLMTSPLLTADVAMSMTSMMPLVRSTSVLAA